MEFFGRFLVLCLIFGLGLGFWLSLDAVTSAWTPSGSPSLLIAASALPIIAYANVVHVGDFILTIITGNIGASAAGLSSPSYGLSFVISDVISQNSISTAALNLFRTGTGQNQFALPTLWSWSTGYTGNYGVPDIVLLVYLFIFSILLAAAGMLKFSRAQI